MDSKYPYPIFRNYLEEEDDKPYYTMNTLAFYYEDMERKQKLIESLAKNIAGYDIQLTENLASIEQQVAEKFTAWDLQTETLPATVTDLVETWVTDGTIDTIIEDARLNLKTDKVEFNEFVNDTTAQLAETKTDRMNVISLGVKNTGLTADANTNTQIINEGLTNNKELYLPDGVYYVSSSLIVPAKKRLIMTRNCIIKPTGDFDVIVYNTFSYIENGVVDVSEIANFTKSALINGPGTVSTPLIKGFQAYRGSSNGRSGNGITLRCTAPEKHVVAFGRFEDFYIQYFKKAINIEVPDINNVNWANANVFSGTSSVNSSAVYNINGSGNYFNIHAQTGTEVEVPCVYIKGNDNVITGKLYDIGNPNSSKIGVELLGTNNAILMEIPNKFVVDHNNGENDTPLTRKFTSTAKGVGIPNGSQDNFLVASDLRFAVTEVLTSGVTNPYPTIYPLKNVFKSFGLSGVDYLFADPSSETENAEITIDLGSNNYITSLGFTNTITARPRKAILSVFSSYDNKWHSIQQDNINSRNTLWDISSALSYNVYTTVTKIRFNFYQPFNANKRIGIISLFASSASGSYGFVPMDGGKIYGDLDFAVSGIGSVVRTPDGTKKYRIGVDNSGALKATLVE